MDEMMIDPLVADPVERTDDLPDFLPISYLNALEYCPRRFYYECALGEMLVNEHVLEGKLLHEGSDLGRTTVEDGKLTLRRVYLYSERLRISGFADVVEHDLASGTYTPVEYKKGRLGHWLNDHIQLCAQALCLEERTGRPVPRGYLFAFGSMRRGEVVFSPELRARTEAAIAQAFALLRAGVLPPPLPAALDAKCRDCSLEPLCLPREVRQLCRAST